MPFASIVSALIITPGGLLWWFIVGLVAGLLARLVFRSRYGVVGDIIIGILGAFFGGFLASLLGLSSTDLISSFIIPFIGSCIFLAGLRIIAAITISIPRVDQK